MNTIVEILIDNSNSMGLFKIGNKDYLLPDGSTRMSLAKTVLIENILPSIEHAHTVIVRLFTTHLIKKVASLKIDRIYKGPFDLVTLQQLIRNIPDPIKTGGTPISDAIQKSIFELAKYPNYDRKIILVTDGQESSDSNYKKTAKLALKQYGVPCNIFIIGIAQSKEAKIKSRELSSETGGIFVGLESKVYNKETLQSDLLPLKNSILAKSVENSTLVLKPIIAPKITTPTKSAPPTIDKITNPTINKSEHEIAARFGENDNSLDISGPIIHVNKDANKNNNQFNEFILERLEQNTKAIGLISKQLSNISEVIQSGLIKNHEEDTDDGDEENREHNEKVRLATETLLFKNLKNKFGDRVRWLNELKEQGGDHDFEVLDTNANFVESYIECKGSVNAEKVFLMTAREWLLFLANTKNYQLYFISNALSIPTITLVDNLLDWILTGKIVPYSSKSTKFLKADRIKFTIVG